MAQPAPLPRIRTTSLDSLWFVLGTATPIMLLSLFAVVHIQSWRDTGSITGLGFAFQESVLIALFLIRRRPSDSMNTVGAWVSAVIGSWGILLLQPQGSTLFDVGAFYVTLQFIGAGVAVAATVFLGRSFGIVAANRGIKTNGAYRIVRHPIYASYLIGLTGYLLSAASIWNLLVVAVALSFQIKRIYFEESVLSRDPEYRAYAARVRYRLIPFVF